jgi:hypothetical protein
MTPELSRFAAPFQTTTRDCNQAAVILAAGYFVEVRRQPAGRRALFTFDDTPTIRDLLERYELGQALSIPPKKILQARTTLYHQARKVCLGGES